MLALRQACEVHYIHPARLHQSLVLHPLSPAASRKEGQKTGIRNYSTLVYGHDYRMETSEPNKVNSSFWDLQDNTSQNLGYPGAMKKVAQPSLL